MTRPEHIIAIIVGVMAIFAAIAFGSWADCANPNCICHSYGSDRCCRECEKI